MKMISGTGTISNYGQFISNCQLRQWPYRIPVNGLTDVQLYVDIGAVRPTAVTIELIYTCGPLAGNVVALTSSSYVIGQTPENNWYAVFKSLVGTVPSLSCFVIAVTFEMDESPSPGSAIYFSEEFCIEDCQPLIELKGCYGHLSPRLSTDCEGIYFGVHAGESNPLGDSTVTYEHKLFLRQVEVTVAQIKNSFKQGRTRSFRTEKEKIFQFWSELVPEWYIPEIDSIFYRGEVFIDGTRYLVNETQYEKAEECFKTWKPWATLKESCYKSFSCEADPCAPVSQECCDPIIVNATVTVIAEESQGSEPGPPPSEGETIVIEALVDSAPVVTGTTDPVTGITDGSSVITCDGFAGVRVIVERGNIPLPGIDPGGGGAFYTKNLADNFITLSDGLVNGEYIYIQTIPE